jgi:hypothetical protein
MTEEDFRTAMLSFRSSVIERLDVIDRLMARHADALERLVQLVERHDDVMQRYDALVGRIERLERRLPPD